MLEIVVVSLVAAVFLVAYLRSRLFRCPGCGFRSDVDHLVEASGEAPYCAYCGTQMNYVGRKSDAWRARLTGSELEPRAKASEVEPEGVVEYLVGWVR